MNQELLYDLATLIERFISIYFISGLLGNKFIGYKKWTFLTATAIVQFVMSFLMLNIYASYGMDLAVGYICFFMYSVFCLEGTYIKKATVSLFPIIVTGIISFLVPYVISIISGVDQYTLRNHSSNIRVITLIMTKVVYLFVVLIIIYLVSKWKNDYSNRQWMLFGAVQLFIVIVLFLMFMGLEKAVNNEVNQLFFLTACGGIIFSNIILIILMNRMNQMQQIKMENTLLQQQSDYKKEHVVEVQQMHQEIRQVQHDMKNYLSTAVVLLEKDRLKEAKDYLSSLIDEKIDSQMILVETGDEILDAVINQKISSCYKSKIKVMCAVPSDLKIDNSVDACAILSNLFDNAIEACEVHGKNRIWLEISEKRDYFSIVMKNEIRESVLDINPNLTTSKEDKNAHGLGTKSMRRIVEQHQGMIDFYEENNKFICDILLKKETF